MIPLQLSRVSKMIGATPYGLCSDPTVTSVCTDSRTIREGDLFFALRGPHFDAHEFVDDVLARGASACVVDRDKHQTPATSPNRRLLVVDNARQALGLLARRHRTLAGASVVAVTGSNGKTTTKNMIAAVLSARFRVRAATRSFNNDVGVPLTLLACADDDDYVVVEIGSNAMGEVAALASIASPDAGVVTSIGAAHLQGFARIENVAAEKLSLFDHVRSGGFAAGHAAAVPATCRQRRRDLQWCRYGTETDADVQLTQIAIGIDESSALIDATHKLRLAVPGEHNLLNAAAAFVVGRRFGVDTADILKTLAAFKLPEFRMAIHRVGDLTVINDCYNANPASFAAAIRVLAQARAGRRVLVAADMAELGDDSDGHHRSIGRLAAGAGCECVVSIGKLAAQIAAEARRLNPDTRVIQYDDTASAAANLPGEIHPDDTVLIKGSRSAGLESIWPQLQARFAGR